MKTYEFTKCWVGSYVGDGEYVGEGCPDVLITNVHDNFDDSEVFDHFLMCYCDGFSNYDKIEYKSRIVERRSKTRIPVKLNSLKELINCDKDYIELDHNDLLDWICDNYL